jgi:hypothetical protein
MRNYHFTLIFFLILAISNLSAQNKFWTPTNAEGRDLKGIRYIKPDEFKIFHFDAEAFRNGYLSKKSNLRSNTFEVPMPDGNFLSFELSETPVFDTELMEKYPGFTSFTGINIAGDRLKLSISPFGINAMVISSSYGHIFIDPLTLHDHQDIYQVYNKNDFRKKTGNFTCGILPPADDITFGNNNDVKEIIGGSRFVGDCQLRSYRLAISCTGEYASFHGGTKEKVLAAYNNTMTRVNGLYEADAGVTMKLVGNTDKIIYLNATTDPFNNGDGEIMLDQNQTTIDNVIGKSNYDIGHVFSTGGGGIAQLRSPCSDSKAMGVTGQNMPVGDPFDIDYVAHEMGHQFGANHTQNNSCQRSTRAAMEPGSASTIMGYAGICDPNVQNNSDAYFHAYSLSEIASFVVAGNGNSCAQIIPNFNSKPQVSVTKNEYNIPKTTSFALTAAADDGDGDTVTYCWEQMNNEVATMPPSANSSQGPTFRSVTPSVSPTRYFPDLLRKYGQWEVLPAVTRDLDFRCTVRDNHPLKGCTDEVNVVVKVTSNAGPFVVTYPNTASVSWLTGSTQTVTWDVAKTNLSPINCAAVNIYLSADGGATYPTLLAENVQNTGSSDIIVPGILTVRAKVMVRAADNIFFDVSNVNFKIVSSFNIALSQANFDICDENSLQNTIEIGKVQDSSVPIILSLNNPPLGLTYDYSINPINILPETSELTINGLQSLDKGWNNFQVKAERGTEFLSANFNIFMGYYGNNTISNIQPAKNEFNVPPNNVNFIWEELKGIKEYTLELSPTPSFANVTYSTTTTNTSTSTSLESGKVYFWRVKPNTPCKTLPYSDVSAFRTIGSNVDMANLLKNEALLVDKSSSATIDTSLLNVAGMDTKFITFTITKITEHGFVNLLGAPLSIGSTFTLEDVILDRVTYQHNGNASDTDVFNFNILDDQGRWLPDVPFVIRIKQGNLGLIAYRDKLLNCFGDSDAIISCEAYGGLPPYSYSLDDINYQLSSIFPNLKSGSYSIYVKDALGNISSSNAISIVDPTELVSNLSLDKYDVKINASGGTGTLSYSIDGIQFGTEPSFFDLGNGQFEIIVKDELGCTNTQLVDINIEPLTIVSNLQSDVKCANQSAIFSMMSSGGFEPYLYSFDGINYQPNPSFTIPPGKYAFSVKDSGNKIVTTDSISSSMPKPIEVQLMQDKLVITVVATGGTGPLRYSTNNINYTENNVITFNQNGSYKVYVRDTLLCSKVTNLTLNVLKDINITARDLTCHEKMDGYIKLGPVNGAQPFRYSLNNSPLSNVREWSGLAAGDYIYVLKDNKNDSLTGIITLKQPEKLTLDFVIKDKDLEVVTSGGTPPYVHSIDNGFVFFDTNQFTDLEEPKYEVVVKDKNGCLVSGTALLSSADNEELLEAVTIMPNPTSGLVYLKINDPSLTDLDFYMTDVTGRSYDVSYLSKASEYTLDMASLPSGVYIIKVISKFRSMTKRIVKE